LTSFKFQAERSVILFHHVNFMICSPSNHVAPKEAQ
jgi:hypothetical protein